MEESEIKNLQKKLDITSAATQLYIKQNGEITLHDIAKQADITVAEIFDYFSSKEEILHFFYTSLILRYRLMITEIEGFDTFTISEKLSNFAYACFDMMEEREEFVNKTFRSFVLHRCVKTRYEKEIEELLYNFFKHDPGKSAGSDLFINDYSLPFIVKKYLRLINFWLNDESEGKEVTIELTDKITGLIQELLYTSVVDRTADIVKFFFSNNTFSDHIPCLKKITSSFEIR